MVESNGNELIKLKFILRQNLLATISCFLCLLIIPRLHLKHIIGLTLQTLYL